MNKKTRIINIICNSLIVVLTIVAVLLMFFGKSDILSGSRWEAFKFFTVQSNVFAGIAAGISLFYLLFKKDKYPAWVSVTKLVAASGVAVTFFTVVTYLSIVYKDNLSMLYLGANMFMHVIIPILSILSVVLFEPKTKLRFAMNLYSMLPVTIYGIIYIANVAAHNDYGNVKGWDWYAFGTYGLGIGVLCLSIIIALSFAFSVGMYFLFQKTKIKKIHD